ncbi:DNA polymerase III subunit beta [Patescibacteria group bacterium]
MKVSVLQENLAKGVNIAGRMVASKAQLPVLSNILLATDKGKLRLSATDLDTGVNMRLGGKVEKEGKITVPAKIFLDLVSSLPKETVYLEVEGDRLKVKAGKFKAVVNGISAEEFPEVPSLEKGKAGKAIELDSSVLRDSLSQVALAAGVDEARPIFTGVKLEMGGKEIRMAATDGYRLSVKSIKGLEGAMKKQELVVPAKALMELVKVLGGDPSSSSGQVEDRKVKLAAVAEEKQLIMVYEEIEIVTRLLEGDFPDFEKIIPSSSSTKIELSKEDLSRAVRAAAIFARDSANIVKFKINDKGLLISANAPQVGENEVQVEGKKTGEDAEIAFNSRYLTEMLSTIDEENIRLETSGALSPGVFKLLKDSSFLHIIMPVRVQD